MITRDCILTGLLAFTACTAQSEGSWRGVACGEGERSSTFTHVRYRTTNVPYLTRRISTGIKTLSLQKIIRRRKQMSLGCRPAEKLWLLHMRNKGLEARRSTSCRSRQARAAALRRRGKARPATTRRTLCLTSLAPSLPAWPTFLL
jgi:hypothetical protein